MGFDSPRSKHGVLVGVILQAVKNTERYIRQLEVDLAWAQVAVLQLRKDLHQVEAIGDRAYDVQEYLFTHQTNEALQLIIEQQNIELARLRGELKVCD